VLAAIGCFVPGEIDEAADSIYKCGAYRNHSVQARLVAVGHTKNKDLLKALPEVAQLAWPEIARFVGERFIKYRHPKTDVSQWGDEGKLLRQLAESTRDPDKFVRAVLKQIGVKH